MCSGQVIVDSIFSGIGEFIVVHPIKLAKPMLQQIIFNPSVSFVVYSIHFKSDSYFLD